MRGLALLLLVLAAPAALAQKPEGKPAVRAVSVAASPFVGAWDYVVRPADPMAQGAFVIESRGRQLAGTFQTDAPRPIDPFELSGDAFAFTFKQPGMGTITIRGTLSGDAFEGTAHIEGQEDVLPFVATRQGATSTADQ